ncbi:unannotated protein [freshwater metagenome]|uniref:Unannotated protein n=1 Tax=freshwater metagenome TaxID=449393 RepID=A0A6J7FB23_9ZZZZ|nr:MBL fold metallo-hydrolase [Actinomycetota bacterium]
MFFKQYYLGCLSHASYLIGDTASGRAVVVDPQRDISGYLHDAAAAGLSIERVIETHFHADFLSGHLELAEATGAVISFGADAAGRTEFAMEPLGHLQRLELGDVVLEIRATPGHTPESISIVVYGRSDADAVAVLTGDTLFIGDVGRPDLLSSVGVSADGLARQLFHSLHEQLLTLPDATKVYPAHGAGSACGKNLSTDTVSTIGEQRRTNYALAPMTEEQFVHAVTEGQAAAPMYFLFAANKNRAERTILDEADQLAQLDLNAVLAAQRDGAAVIDTRDNADFSGGHLRGSINVGLSGRFAEYTGEVVRPNTPIVLVSDAGYEPEARIRLSRIGFDTVIGVLANPMQVFQHHPDVVESASRLTVQQFEQRRASLATLQIVDVRGPGEVEHGMIAGAIHIELPALLARLGELDPTVPTVVYCAGGYRSSIAASALRANGFTDVSDILGGYTAWATLRDPAPPTVG